MKWLAVLAFVSALALAQDPNACTVEGRVLNALTGEPVPKAHVKLFELRSGGNIYATTTDSGGQFTLNNVAAGPYQLSAAHNGYVEGIHGARPAARTGTPVVLKAGQKARDLVVRLTPQGVIAGRILDQDGDPLANVEVQVMRYMYIARRRQLQNSGAASTNDLGEYRLFGLSPGRYYLHAAYHPGPEAAAGELTGEEAYPPTYYPGTFDPASARTLEISAGSQLRGIDMTLARTRAVRVRGRATSAMNLPVGRIFVHLSRSDSAKRYVVGDNVSARGPEGNFELRGVTPGSYIITAQAGEDGRRYVAQMPIEVGNTNIDNISLVVAPGFDLNGQVAAEGTANVRLTGLLVLLSAPDADATDVRGGLREKGVFVLQSVIPDHYQLNVLNLTENFYIKSIRLGTEDALQSGLNLTRGPAGPIEILLSGNGGQIDGAVLNAQQQPTAGATVELVPEARLRDQMRLYKNVATDQTGHFSIKGIAPGDYKLFAWEDAETGAYDDPEFMKAFEGLGEAFSIHEGSREKTQLKLIPAER